MVASVTIDDIDSYLRDKLESFHTQRLQRVQDLKPRDLVRKNPYLHRSLNLTRATDLVNHLMSSFISSSDEGKFGKLLEDLAIQVCREAYGGQKSAAEGPDLDFVREGIRYLVSIKSGPNWGNDSQWKQLSAKLTSAIRRVRQEDPRTAVFGVCGVCYGNKTHTKEWQHMRVYGQDFWELVSGNETLYRDLILPVGAEADRFDVAYAAAKDKAYNRLTEFISEEFVVDGDLDWLKIVDFVSQSKSK